MGWMEGYWNLRAVQLYPASKQRARQAAAQPPVAPKKEMFWIDAIVCCLSIEGGAY
jgi:hypothetical protein